MAITVFQVFDKLGRSQFFQETFLLTDISIEVVIGILFQTFNNADIQFTEKEFIWKIYTIIEALPTNYRVKFIN